MTENPVIPIIATIAVVYLIFYVLKDRKRAKKDLDEFTDLYFTPMDFLLGRKSFEEVKSIFNKLFTPGVFIVVILIIPAIIFLVFFL